MVVECSDAPALAEFWSKVLGVTVIASDDSWASLHDPSRGRISFQTVEGYEPPSWPGSSGDQQMHLDVLVEQLDWSSTCVLDWGATALTEILDPGPKAWRIFADPAGHPFCLVTVPE